MNKILKYKLIAICLIVAVFSGVGIYFYAYTVLSVADKTSFAANRTLLMPPASPIYENSNNKVSNETKQLPRIAEIHSFFSIRLGDDKILMGASHNVFVGKVLSQIGTIAVPAGSDATLPVTQFSVKPILNIKGNLQGTVTVEQFGGYQDGVLYVSDGGDAFIPSSAVVGGSHLMQPGSTYLFATRYQSDGAYYLWAATPASKLISQDNNLSNGQLQDLAANDERVKQLQAAYPNEILEADDIKNNNTRNSYQSLHQTSQSMSSSALSSSTVASAAISNLASVVASSSVTISWNTDTPNISQLLFGSSTAMLGSLPFDPILRTNHSVYISGLTPNTPYYYEVRAKDSSGNTGSSAQQSFTTVGQ